MRKISLTIAVLLTHLSLQADDVTENLINLGNPGLDNPRNGPYGRNVWDLEIFDGRLYIGTGNSSNLRPEINSGPAPIWTYDIAAGTFASEGTFGSEQSEIFREIDRSLYIPNHDPVAGDRGPDLIGRFSMFIRNDGSGWTPSGWVPTVHIYDVAKLGNSLFVTTGPSTGRQVKRSDDGGQTWIEVSTSVVRGYRLFQHQGKLYSTGLINNAPASLGGKPTVYNEQTEQMEQLDFGTNNAFFPATPAARGVGLFDSAKIHRTAHFLGKLVYIGGVEFNDHQTQPFGLYHLDSLNNAASMNATRLRVESNSNGQWPWRELPWDLNVENGRLYVLLAGKIDNLEANDFKMRVVSTDDLVNWTEELSFTSDTFARSFEISEAGYFFGMGTGISDVKDGGDLSNAGLVLSQTSGTIYHLPRNSYETGLIDITQAGRNAWTQINFDGYFENPIVVLGTPTSNSTEPATTRVRNVTSNSFEFQIDEWDYLNGSAPQETIPYLVMSEGRQNIGGFVVEAGVVPSVNHNWKSHSFLAPAFGGAQTLIAQCVTRNGGSAVSTRVRNLTNRTFQVRVTEEEGRDRIHANETIHYIAISRGRRNVDGVIFQAGTTPNVNHNAQSIALSGQSNGEIPMFFGQTVTQNGGDTFDLKLEGVPTDREAIVFLQEEQSANDEVRHVNEEVRWLIID